MNKSKALFLDRDGVINVDLGYVHTEEQFIFIDGIFELTIEAKRLGYKVAIITNQAGIGKGYYSEEAFLNLMSWVNLVFLKNGVDIDGLFYCPYHLEGKGEYRKFSLDRKPGPGLFLRAQMELGIDLKESVLIGDKDTDIYAGLSAGVGRCILLGSSLKGVDGDIEFVDTLKDIKLG